MLARACRIGSVDRRKMHFIDGFVSSDDPARLVHVGWLDRAHDFPRGEVPRPFFEKLIALCCDPSEPFAAMGFHACDLHQFTAGPRAITFAGKTVDALFRSNLFIPDGVRIFYAPSAIVHYVDAFFYRPPEDFIDAVMKCPPARSIEFKKLFLASGGSALMPPKMTPEPTASSDGGSS